MTTEQPGNTDPLVPPTEPGALPPIERATTWPRTLGIISIILGTLGTLGGLLGSSVSLMVQAMQMSVADKDAVNWDAVRQAVVWMARMSVIAGMLSVLLLVIGIGLVRRRPWAIPTAKVWAVLKILMVIVNLGISTVIQRSIAEAIQQAGTTSRGPALHSTPTGIAFGLAWGCALPVFMLIWFARQEIREEIARWR